MSPVFVMAEPALRATLGDRPLYAHLLDWLRGQGVREVTFCSDHKIACGDGAAHGVCVRYANTLPRVPEALVLKGDRLFTLDLALFRRFATDARNVALHFAREAGPKDRVSIDRAYRITGVGPSPLPDGYVDGGIYLLRGEVSEAIAEGARGLPMGGRLVTPDSPDPAHWLNEPSVPCLFLDRDGVIVRHVNYLHEPAKVELVPEVTRLMVQARERGWRVVMVSNQSGVGRGLFGEDDCDATNARIRELLAEEGATIDAYSCCFEHPREGRGVYLRESVRRKPGAGMLLEACSRFRIDVGRSLMIGDNETDQIDLPGLRTMLIKGDFAFKSVRADTVVNEDFAQLGRNASAFLADNASVSAHTNT